jgi:hypothetical protein
MKTADRNRASLVNQDARTAFRGARWFLLGILLLLPIGIGITTWQSRSSGARERPEKSAYTAPTRLDQAEASTADVHRIVEKSKIGQTAEANSTDENPRSSAQKHDAVAPGASHAVLAGSKLRSPSGDKIAISKITPAFVPSPVYELRSGPKKVFQPRNWLELEVEFSVRKPLPDGALFRLEVLMNGTIFTGDVAIAPLEKGDGFLTVAYVSPNSLQRAFHRQAPGFDKGVRIEITVLAKEEQIGSASWMTGSASSIERELVNAIRPKSETPFAPLFWDRYVDPADLPFAETSPDPTVTMNQR